MESTLKPITKEEKLVFTLKIEIEKMIDEILGQLFHEEKYSGVVEIWPEINENSSGELKVEVKHQKIQNTTVKKKNKWSIRYHVAPEKGVKLLT